MNVDTRQEKLFLMLNIITPLHSLIFYVSIEQLFAIRNAPKSCSMNDT